MFFVKRLDVSDLLILDAGCGGGDLSVVLAKCKPKEVVSIDLNAELISDANDNIKGQGLSGITSPIRSDLRSIPLKSNLFDLVVSYHLLCSVNPNTLGKISLESYRVLKRNGRLVMLEQSVYWRNEAQNAYLLRCKLFLEIAKSLGIPCQGYLYETEKIEKYLKSVGFRKISISAWEIESKVSRENTEKMLCWMKKHSNILHPRYHGLLTKYLKKAILFGEERTSRLMIEGYKTNQ